MKDRSLYQQTKTSIEQGIIQLQDRIRKRKNLDFQRQLLDQNIIRSDKLYQYQMELGDLHRVYQNAKYQSRIQPNILPYKQSLIVKEPILNASNLTLIELQQKIRKQSQHLEYLKKLQRMNYENSQIDILAKSMSPLKKTVAYQAPIYRQPLASQVKKYVDPTSNLYQYDEFQDDSSTLVDNYLKGNKAQQYYQDIQRLDDLQRKMNAIDAQRSKFVNRIDFQTPKQLASPQKFHNLEKTKQKTKIPIIKQQIEQGGQTVINVARQKPHQSPKKQAKTTSFINQRLQNIIQQQKTDSRIKKTDDKKQINQSNPTSHRKQSSRMRISNQKLGKTIDLSTLNRSQNSPIKRIRQNSKKRQINPYINVNKNKNPKKKNSKSLLDHKKTRSNSQNINKTREVCIMAPIFPASQTINFQQSMFDKIQRICHEKIQNRLKISSIVFKDSKLRNVKHQMDHLLSKFQNQIKGRKDIKDRINTNPRILRKHHMVVE